MSSGRNRTARRHEGAHAVVAQPAAQLPEQASGTPRCALTSMMQLVEIASVLQTSDAVCAAVQEMSGGIGETPGVSQVSYRYVINRVLVPMINEAINCLYDGLAEPADLDAIFKLGPEPAIGPLAWTTALVSTPCSTFSRRFMRLQTTSSIDPVRRFGDWSMRAYLASRPDRASTTTAVRQRARSLGRPRTESASPMLAELSTTPGAP